MEYQYKRSAGKKEENKTKHQPLGKVLKARRTRRPPMKMVFKKKNRERVRRRQKNKKNNAGKGN